MCLICCKCSSESIPGSCDHLLWSDFSILESCTTWSQSSRCGGIYHLPTFIKLRQKFPTSIFFAPRLWFTVPQKPAEIWWKIPTFSQFLVHTFFVQVSQLCFPGSLEPKNRGDLRLAQEVRCIEPTMSGKEPASWGWKMRSWGTWGSFPDASQLLRAPASSLQCPTSTSAWPLSRPRLLLSVSSCFSYLC